jgi:hypothetical protein
MQPRRADQRDARADPKAGLEPDDGRVSRVLWSAPGVGGDDQVLHGPGDRPVTRPVERRPDRGGGRAIGGSGC